MEEKRKSRPWGMWIAVGLMLLPVIYILSTGPVVWMSLHHYLPETGMLGEAIDLYYVPANWLLDWYPNSPPGKALLWYLTLWGRPDDVILVPRTE